MKRLTIDKLAEIRRACSLLAGALMLVALAFPVWKIVLRARQIPGTDLVVKLYAYPRIAGDYEQVHSLNKYVGFYYPDPVFVTPNYEVQEAALQVPEWTFAPLLFVALSLGAVYVALSPEPVIARRLKRYFVGTLALMAAVLGWAQFRLYQAGHNLDPDAPLTGVDGFTPPVLGPYEVANISGFSWFATGGYMLVAAVALLGVAYLARDTDAPVTELPTFVDAGVEQIQSRVTNK